MNSTAHTRIMRAAFAALPPDFMAPLGNFGEVIDVAGNYPDLFDNPLQTEEKKRAIDPEWMRFCQFPKTMEASSFHAWPHGVGEQHAWQPVVRHWLQGALDAWRIGDYTGFIKFIGCLSHIAGDVTQPAHVFGMESGMVLMEELLPRPAHIEHFNYHSDLEAVTGHCQLPLPPPRLLGTNVEEATWRICGLNLSAIREMRRYIIPTLQAIFAGDMAEAERLAGPPVTLASRITQDILYTALCLARENAPEEERHTLDVHDLRFWPADEESHDFIYGARAVVDGSLRIPPYPGPVVPAALRFAEGIRIVPAIGVFPRTGVSGTRETWMRYTLPPGVFGRFHAWVGLHAELGLQGEVEFVVELDGKEAWKSGKFTGAESARLVEVSLGEAEILRLLVRDCSDGRLFWHNHALWAEPRLMKNNVASASCQ